ncbi:hypothetical protein BDZ89DRAFT_1118298 [Hymenopellis radicata]|nr:hypothetical protein BDZ89DRAFT_1118298 [Hymenopellis radicata]
MAQTPLTHTPFDSPFTEDLVMRTSDDISLRVTTAILVVNSPFFANLFSDSTPDETEDGLPVFRAAEDCRTLCAILHLCYPTSIPLSATIEAMATGHLVPALRKYIMVNAEKRLRNSIMGSEWPKKEPLKAFAMARGYGWEDLIRISVLDYVSLLDYFRRCSNAAVSFLQCEWYHHSSTRKYLKVNSYFPDMEQCFVPHSETSASTTAMICKYCSEVSDYHLVSVSQNTLIWMHDWLSTLLYKVKEEAKTRPRLGRDDFLRIGKLDENSRFDCPSQKPSVVREVLELLERGLESAISAVELEIDEWRGYP